MTLKIVAKFKEKLACSLENDMSNLANFYQSTWKCQNLDFDEIFLSKVEKAWAKNLQRNYVYWHRRMIKHLKKNWLFVSKFLWRIWQILTWALKSLKNLYFNGLLLTNIHNVWAKKVQMSYLSWHWKLTQKFKKINK